MCFIFSFFGFFSHDWLNIQSPCTVGWEAAAAACRTPAARLSVAGRQTESTGRGHTATQRERRRPQNSEGLPAGSRSLATSHVAVSTIRSLASASLLLSKPDEDDLQKSPGRTAKEKKKIPEKNPKPPSCNYAKPPEG